ncbi:MAG: CPBP family intramembrane metalloprotease [Nodosilinea sp. LVE1205-7]
MLFRWRAIPWRYPLSPDHKLILLIPLYLLAPLALETYRRYWTGLPWATYGINGRGQFFLALALGFAIALSGIGVFLATQLGLGWRQWQGYRPKGRTLLSLLVGLLPLTLLIAGVEETLFRGLLPITLQSLLPWPALVITVGLIFACSHLLWDGPQGLPQLPGLTLMGIVLMVARWVTAGQLGLAWGLHAGWILGLALTDSLALTKAVDGSPLWLAGKPDQPLTGLAGLGLLLLTGLGLWLYGQTVGTMGGSGWPG